MVRYMMRDGIPDGVIARVMGWTVRDVMRFRPRRTYTEEQRRKMYDKWRAQRFAARVAAWEKRRAEA